MEVDGVDGGPGCLNDDFLFVGVVLFLPEIVICLWFVGLVLCLDVRGSSHSNMDLCPCILPPSLTLRLGVLVGRSWGCRVGVEGTSLSIRPLAGMGTSAG